MKTARVDPLAAALIAREEAEAEARELINKLTARQKEVLVLRIYSKDHAECAERLEISPDAVKEHLRAVKRHLQTSSLLEAAVLATRARLL
jgi:DNA-binding NarL/FixJ family response regulator